MIKNEQFGGKYIFKTEIFMINKLQTFNDTESIQD